MKELPFDPYDFFGYLAAGYILIAGLDLVFGVPDVIGRDFKTFDIFLFSLSAYIIGQIAASPSKFLLETLVIQKVLGSPSELLIGLRKRSILKFIFPGYYSALPKSRIGIITKKAKSEGCNIDSGEDLFLHIRFHNEVRSDSALMIRLSIFLNKYGFSRNLCFSCLLFGSAVLLTKGNDLNLESTKYAYLALVLGILLFLRYLKFFRQYTYELFNSYAGN